MTIVHGNLNAIGRIHVLQYCTVSGNHYVRRDNKVLIDLFREFHTQIINFVQKTIKVVLNIILFNK